MTSFESIRQAVTSHEQLAIAMASATALDEQARKLAEPLTAQFKVLMGEHSALAAAMRGFARAEFSFGSLDQAILGKAVDMAGSLKRLASGFARLTKTASALGPQWPSMGLRSATPGWSQRSRRRLRTGQRHPMS
ncbi:MAG: hypothetical protein WEA29_09025 [Acidimicrobiia bacterium]